MAERSKPPKGKVRSKTPVPTSPRATDPAPSPGRRSTRLGAIVVPVLAVTLAIGLGVFLGVRSAHTSDASTTPTAATTESTDTTPARTAPVAAKELFADACASCHTLKAAGATGGIGPNLDEAKPSRERVRTQIRTGSLSGAMPANLLAGDEAERVAAYVAKNAGAG
jgi:cytochrome c6